jgi:hypothetical protein
MYVFFYSGANWLFGWYSLSPSFLFFFVGIGREKALEVAMQFGYGAAETMMRFCRLGHIAWLRHSELFVSSSLCRCYGL